MSKTPPSKANKAESGEQASPAKAKKAKRAPKASAAPTMADEPVAENVASKAKAPAAAQARAGDAALLKRLEEMTDFQLRAYQESTMHIARTTAHVKSAAAKITLPLIEAEVARRKISPGRAPSPVRAAVASPKTGKKRNSDD
jgi:hypothetical protein